MVEVFKTDVREVTGASQLKTILIRHFPDSTVNFDRDDCDKVLKISQKGKDTFEKKVFACEELL